MTIALSSGASSGIWVPPKPQFPSTALSVISSIDLNASTDNVTMVGRHINKDAANKTVVQVHLNVGAVTDTGPAADSSLEVRIETVDPATGPPYQGTGTLINGLVGAKTIDTLTPNAFNAINVTDGALDYLAHCAVKISLNPFGAADSANIRMLNRIGVDTLYAGVSTDLTGTQAIADLHSNVIFEYSDGGFGTLDGAIVFSAFSAVSINTAANAEAALEFSIPWAFKAYGVWMYLTHTGVNRNITYALYDDASAPAYSAALAVTPLMDAEATGQTITTSQIGRAFFTTPYTIAKNTTYRLAARAAAAAVSTLEAWDFAAADHRQCHFLGTNGASTTRTGDGATWAAATTTRIMLLGLIGFPDDGAGAAGMLGHPGMSGRINS